MEENLTFLYADVKVTTSIEQRSERWHLLCRLDFFFSYFAYRVSARLDDEVVIEISGLSHC